MHPRRSLWDLDVEIGTLVFCTGLVVAGLCRQCGQGVMTLGVLGLVASLSAIIGWARRPRHDKR